MTFAPVLHAEWLKIRTLRSLAGTLPALVVVTALFSALAASAPPEPESDALFTALSGALLGQIAAMTFGALAVSSEFPGGLRLSLAAVPRRGQWFAAKAVAVAVPALVAGLVAAVAALAAARSVSGSAADGVTVGEQVRAVVGCGVYLMLTALLAAGLTALLRSGLAALALLVPLVVMVSFVIGDAAGTAADFLPDRAGQVVMRQTYDGTLGPWTGLAVTGLWTAGALLAGAWSVRRRDA